MAAPTSMPAAAPIKVIWICIGVSHSGVTRASNANASAAANATHSPRTRPRTASRPRTRHSQLVIRSLTS